MKYTVFLMLFLTFVVPSLGQTTIDLEGYWENAHVIRYYSCFQKYDDIIGCYYLDYNLKTKKIENLESDYHEIIPYEGIIRYYPKKDDTFDIDTVQFLYKGNSISLGAENLKRANVLIDKSFQKNTNFLEGTWELDTMFFEGDDWMNEFSRDKNKIIYEFRFTSATSGNLTAYFETKKERLIRNTSFSLIRLGAYWFLNTKDLGADMKFASFSIHENGSFILREIITVGGEIPTYKNHRYIKYKD